MTFLPNTSPVAGEERQVRDKRGEEHESSGGIGAGCQLEKNGLPLIFRLRFRYS